MAAGREQKLLGTEQISKLYLMEEMYYN